MCIRDSLWMPPELRQRLQAAHGQTLELLQGLCHRLQQARAGFEALPLEAATGHTEAPAPVAFET